MGADMNGDPCTEPVASPERVLEVLVETALALCGAEAAGVAALDEHDGAHWRARAGSTDAPPTDTESCRMALERGAPATLALGGSAHALAVPLPLDGGAAALCVVGLKPFGADDAKRLHDLASLACTAHRAAARSELEALHESEQRFSRFMERLPGLAWIKDDAGRYVFVNDAFEACFGRPRGEILGRADEELFPPDVAARSRKSDRRAIESGAGVEGIEPLQHDGDVRHWLVSRFPIPAAGARPASIGGIAVDVSERMRAEEALRTSDRIYRAIGESTDYGVWVCDAEGRNVYASDSFLQLVGLTQEQCSAFGWSAALHPDDAERTLAAWQECVRGGGTWEVEHRFRGPGGAWHPVLARGVPVRGEHGQTVAWAGIHLDISRQKRVEDELREAHHRKDEFLATLAHELRNPLAPIRSSLAVLRMADLADEARRVLHIVERQVTQLIRVVDDLLEVSRITRNRIELRPERVTLTAVLNAALETSRPAIERARHRLELSLPEEELPLRADPIRLTQVFANVLDNAARYSDAGGRIGVRAWREEARAVVAVSDEGVGIPRAQLAHVFELFVQGEHAAGRAPGGLGIGLTLAQRLAQLHGGSIEARSAGVGRGSEFRVTLPLAGTAPSERAEPAGPEPGPSGRTARARVLVVDDNQDAADSLGMLLEMLGAEARVAYDGAAALDALPGFRPELVLLDLGMPGIDGWEVARRIRAQQHGGPLLVALTGWGQPDDRRRTRDAGFDQHLVKPVDLAALRKLFTRLEARSGPAA